VLLVDARAPVKPQRGRDQVGELSSVRQIGSHTESTKSAFPVFKKKETKERKTGVR